ncbi:MAG: LysM peptidoglycan-binding domain-containing protein, partial [Candidatus Dadabacteria bacterium]|nr:LysM peptidoglycan-binding domain-containing protein [Candidatus Dadabacteria bacterium]
MVSSSESEPEDIKFPIKRNSRVKHYIKRFSGKGKKDFAKFLYRSEKFLPEIKQTLRAEGIPTDIAYLPLIESGFNPRAVSRKNAVGLWQFIKPTGKRYGLRVNYWVDERMHVEKSTLAATKYLRKLYDEFGSWELALAAYNCGENRVARAIARTGSKDFWVISRKLPRETRNYVPKFNAALIIAKNPEKYGFRVGGAPKDYEIVSVPPRKSLAEIANLLDMGYKEIARYNPSLVGLSTPPGKNYQLKVPKGYGEKLLSVKREIENLKNVRSPFSTRPIRYKVRPDDSLWKIARKFGTSVEELKYANRLSSSIIRPGQRLKIPTRTSVVYVKHKIRPGENIYVLARKYGTSIDEIKRANNLKGSLIIAGKTLSIPQKLSYRSAQRYAPTKLNHRIIPGDTLSELALRYRVSVSQIKKWNNMSSTTLIAGRNLVIYK